MSNRILVATDGSLPAQAAANLAIQIAPGQDLSIRGLYVVDVGLVTDSHDNHQAELGGPGEPTSGTDPISQSRKQGDAALQRLEAQCLNGNVPVTTDLLFGGVPEMVLQEAAQSKVLAIGRRGHGHPTDTSHLGRIFRAVAHDAHLPILVGGDEQQPLRRLLLAYNGSEHALNALVWAKLLQHKLVGRVIVLAVQENSSTSEQWLSEMEGQLNTAGLVDYHFVSREGQPAAEILAAASEHQADIVVMGRYRHTALIEWVAGSTLDRVLRGTRLPVLAV